MKAFFESNVCRGRAHCAWCRMKDRGRAWRISQGRWYAIPRADFECPFGREWNARYPVPRVANQCALAESTGVKVLGSDCNCRTWRFLCHWPRYRDWCEARGIDPRECNIEAMRLFLSDHPIPKRWTDKPGLDDLARVSAQENLGLVTVRTCERCPAFVPV